MAKTRNVLATFKTINEAKSAAQEIQSLEIEDMQIDQVGLYPGYSLNDLQNPVTGSFGSLADLTLGSNFSSKSAEILASADVSASGMSDGGDMDIDRNVLVTIVANEAVAKQAEEIIKRYNGII